MALGTTRAVCYVDGFNLYHAIDDLGDPRLKGVNLWALAQSILRHNETLQGVEYFSAYATWLPPSYRRHQQYTAALQGAGVIVNMAHFKTKRQRCRRCSHTWPSREEKETDVHLALRILEDAFTDRYDRALVISADSDLAPAVRKVRNLFPNKQVLICAPPGRRNHARDLSQAANGSILELRKPKIAACLFASHLMPIEWR